MFAAVAELDTRANQKVLHGRGDKDLAGLRQASDPGADVNSDARQVVFADLTFSGV